MVFPFIPSLLLFLTGGSLHLPHDDVHGVATGILADGTRETVIATVQACRVLKTRDNGLSWETVHGDGLELARADHIIFDPNPLNRRFLIGTNKGVWVYDPATQITKRAMSGLPGGLGRFVTSMAAPRDGSDGPVLLSNRLGQVWSLDRANARWDLLLDTGIFDERSQVAVYSNFDSTAGPGFSQSVAAAFGGVLQLSFDGGLSWNTHSQFSFVASSPQDPLITAITFADDFSISGDLVLATSVENLNHFTKDEGQIWQSGDFGVTFQAVLWTDSSVRAIAATPVGPSGQRWFLASTLKYPDYSLLSEGNGIYRSADGGISWDDYGSAQDFVSELDASDTVTLGREKIHTFGISPTYQTDGRIFFGRSEGFYTTRDEGLHWTRHNYRPVTHIRGLDSFVDNQNHLWSFGGSYGSGTIIQEVQGVAKKLLNDGPMMYQDELFLSPNFAEDGMMLVGGAAGLAFWFNPVLGAGNPHGVLGWKSIPKSVGLGYVRYVAFSPHFDGLGSVGSDQTLFFSSSTGNWSNIRSVDGGLTGEPLTRMVGGSPAPWLRNLAVADTYDASTSAGRTDVYGTADVGLFCLQDNRWRFVHQFPAFIETMTLVPDFDRDLSTPGLPKVFVGMTSYPYVAEIVDDPVAPSYREFPEGLERSSIIKILCPPDFAIRPVLYAATFTDGIKKLDLAQVNPVWETVGQNFPDFWVDSFSISPNFATDRLLIVGTQQGIVAGQDVSGANWVPRKTNFTRDNIAPSFRYYDPNHSQNPDPNRPWRWAGVGTKELRNRFPALTFMDESLAYTIHDGAFVQFTEDMSGFAIHTYRGPLSGSVLIEVRNWETGQLIVSQQEDLQGGVWKDELVEVNFPQQGVEVTVTTDLVGGSAFLFDGVTFYKN